MNLKRHLEKDNQNGEVKRKCFNSGEILCVSRKMYYKSSIEVESQMYAIKLTLIG